MRKLLIFIMSLFLGLQAFGQGSIYSKVLYFDKFDDIVKFDNVKTIVQKTDSTFVVETKGEKPVTYYILNVLEPNCAGDKDNIVNLVGDVYGYQTCWCVVRSDMVEDYNKDYYTVLNNCFKIIDNEELTDDEKGSLRRNELDKLGKYYLFVTHRVVVTEYTHSYKSEYFWVEDEMSTKLGKDINRIIYER